MKSEPTLLIQAIVAILNGVQVSAIPMSTLAHTIIVVAVTALGAIVNRTQVTPTAKTQFSDVPENNR